MRALPCSISRCSDSTHGPALSTTKVIQELLRHANLKVAMDTYVQAVTDKKRKAQSKVVEMLLPGIRMQRLSLMEVS
jgi:integrase